MSAVRFVFAGCMAVAAGLFSDQAFGQWCAPSCGSPSCCAPTCAAPASGSACRAAGNDCSCRPNITKIKIKRSMVGWTGAEPPRGIAVSSVPAITVAAPTVAIAPAFTVAAAPANDATVAAVVAAMREMDRQKTASAAAAGDTCPDPCGDIKQLRNDVDRLIGVVDRLTPAVDLLAREHVKRMEQEAGQN